MLRIFYLGGGGGSLTDNTSSTLRLASAVTTITQSNRSRHSTIENFYTSFFPVLPSIVLTFPPLYYLVALSVCTPFSVSPLWVLANPVHKGINDIFLRGKPEDVLWDIREKFFWQGWNVRKEQMIREQLRIHGQDWQGPTGQVTPSTAQLFLPLSDDYLERPPLFFSHYFFSMWTIYILFGRIWKGVLVDVDRSTSRAVGKSFFNRMIPPPALPSPPPPLLLGIKSECLFDRPLTGCSE